MSYIQQIENEEYENSYNHADRFAGFDRGDLGNDEPECGSIVFGRMTSESGHRVELVEEWAGDTTCHKVFINGECVFFEENARQRAVTVGRWWMAGCPA